mgnify:CR=1 FL=1
MKITVLSGKGGTGKTTVATNLAITLDDVQLLDADVEEPNAYIFIEPKFKNDQVKVLRKVPVIDQDKCVACRKCMDFCEYNALALLGEEVLVFPELCHSCGGCKHFCTQDALTEQEREVGEISCDLAAKGLAFWQGELTIGEASAVPVIEQLKEHINNDKIVIIDAPPGTTCPTIEATIDSDFCILVTEPTPFGLHDLKMSIEVVEEFNKPYGVVINRAEDEADYIIEDYLQDKGISLLLKIPFQRQIAELYSEGIPFVEDMPEYKDKFQQVVTEIKKVVR